MRIAKHLWRLLISGLCQFWQKFPNFSNMADCSAGEKAWLLRYNCSLELWSCPNFYNPTAVRFSPPLTLIYILSKFWNRIIREGDSDKLEIHILGASYPFEGLGHWETLYQSMPNYIKQLKIVLVVKEMYFNDNVPHIISRKWNIKSEFPKIKDGLEIRIEHGYYQDIMDRLKVPDLVVMFNPGFPQIMRRTWDPVILHLLEKQIPTVVSVQTVLGNSQKFRPKPGFPWCIKYTDEENEDFPVLTTLNCYGANILSVTGCPFPIIWDHGNTFICKNSVILVFCGLTEGKVLHRAQPISEEDKNFLNQYKIRARYRSLYRALCYPVSRSYDDATRQVYKMYLNTFLNSKNFHILPKSVQNRMLILDSQVRSGQHIRAEDLIFLEKKLPVD